MTTADRDTMARARFLYAVVEPAELRAAVESVGPALRGGHRACNLTAGEAAHYVASRADDERVRRAVGRMLAKRDDEAPLVWNALLDESAEMRAEAAAVFERRMHEHYRREVRPALARRHQVQLQRRGPPPRRAPAPDGPARAALIPQLGGLRRSACCQPPPVANPLRRCHD